MILQTIYNFFYYIQKPFFFFPIALTLLLSFLILLAVQSLTPHIKIKNFIITWSCAIFYFITYIIGIIILRYWQLNTSRDLREIWKQFKTHILGNFIRLSIYNQLLIIICVGIGVVLWFLIIVKLQKVLRHKVWQLYFYYVFRHYVSKKFSRKLEFAMVDYSHHYSFDTICGKFYSKGFPLSPTKTIALTKIVLTLTIPLIITIDCWLNNWTLYYTFYYLFIFIFAINYIYIDETIVHTHGHYEYPEMLIERNYGYPKIVYVNLTEAEENLLALYAASPAKLPYTLDLHHQYTGPSPLFTEHGIKLFRRFEKDDISLIYYNIHTSKGFKDTDLKEICEKWFVEDPYDPAANEYYLQLKTRQKNQKGY